MNKKRQFSPEEARSIGTQLKIDWSQIDLKQFRRGLEVELEHGAISPKWRSSTLPGRWMRPGSVRHMMDSRLAK